MLLALMQPLATTILGTGPSFLQLCSLLGWGLTKTKLWDTWRHCKGLHLTNTVKSLNIRPCTQNNDDNNNNNNDNMTI